VSVALAKAEPKLRRYQLRRLRVPVGARMLDLVVPDARAHRRSGVWVDATLRGAEPPYWCEVWPAAVAAARALAGWRLAGQKVLDLGCGLGVPGLAAAAHGAEVTFADREADALHFAAWNAGRAHPEGLPARTEVLDWAARVVSGSFAVVVLADVTYRRVHHTPLQRQIAAALAADGVVLHADPGRSDSAPFVAWLQREFATTVAERRVQLGERSALVRLCAAARTAAALPPLGSGRGGA
jgi:predicted nicotinamide N-methyase